MLIRFEVSNFRSIAEPVELSMVAVDRDRPEARDAPMLGESLLTVAAVYGPNASGKSNVLAALSWLCDAVRDSMRFWDDEIPVEPYKFNIDPDTPSNFMIELTIQEVRFEYILQLDADHIIYEALFHYPEKKRRRIFERDGLNLAIQRGLGILSGARELLTEKTLALTAARRFDNDLIRNFTDDLYRVHARGPLPRIKSMPRLLFSGRRPSHVTRRWFEELESDTLFKDEYEKYGLESRQQALAMLRVADMGIDDVVILEEADIENNTQVRRRKVVNLLHRTSSQSLPLPFEAESQGTQAWFHLIGPALTALRYGSVLLFDEIDASLHPTLSAELLRIFHSPHTNPQGAQLVFTSHDTSLLGHLNRDEVWLTEKSADGSTRLGALAEFAGERVRKSQNLENAYLHGRFGALPQTDQAELLRALGLIG